MTRRLQLFGIVAALSVAVSGVGHAQGRSTGKGAVIGGLIGGGAVALLGGLIGQGVCDAADCSGAWIDGAVPGAVLGGLGGAVLGGVVGALIPSRRSSPPSGSTARISATGRIALGAARLESNLIDQSVGGASGMAGVRIGALSIGPEVGRVSSSGWRVTTAVLAARLEPAGPLRPFGEIGLGHFSWRLPGVVVDQCPSPNDPQGCTYRDGTISDRYLGAVLGVGVAAGNRLRTWAVTAEARYHHSGGRDGGPGSTVSRQIRQVNVGFEFGFRLK